MKTLTRLSSRITARLLQDTKASQEESRVCGFDLETGAIKANKPYKPRKLKKDAEHKEARKDYKVKMRNPTVKRKAQVQKKKYAKKNKQQLKKRTDFVRKAKSKLPRKPGA